MRKAVVLLSGGLDSATATAVALHEGYECTAITFVYGQRHRIELQYARQLVDHFGIGNHIVVEFPAQVFTSTALVEETNILVPKNRDMESGGVPITYVPARNILFLSYALAIAEPRNIHDIFIGVNAVDYSGYPDCRPEFVSSFETMANIGTKSGVEGNTFHIHTPLITMKKSEIIVMGTRLGMDYSLTHSCYDPDGEGLSCGECDSCRIRKKGFEEAGVTDPTHYRK